MQKAFGISAANRRVFGSVSAPIISVCFANTSKLNYRAYKPTEWVKQIQEYSKETSRKKNIIKFYVGISFITGEVFHENGAKIAANHVTCLTSKESFHTSSSIEENLLAALSYCVAVSIEHLQLKSNYESVKV